jgi:Transglycosylase SLT domain
MRAYSSLARKTSAWVRKSALTILVIVLISAGAAAQSIPGQPDLKALFAAVGRVHNIDPELLEAMAEVESGGDPLSVSPKGALGLMQLMPATADAFSVLNPFNPVANVRGAADFLDYLRNRFANNPNLQGLAALLAAYNAGPGAVEKYGGIPPYAETNRYVRRVIERYTDDLSAQAAAAPVLILGPKPYVIRLTGSHAMQPEPVLISADDDRLVLDQLVTIRSVRGQVVGVIGTGTAPWTRRNPTELSLHRAHKMGSSRNSAIVTLDMPLHPQNVVRAKHADHGTSR